MPKAFSPQMLKDHIAQTPQPAGAGWQDRAGTALLRAGLGYGQSGLFCPGFLQRSLFQLLGVIKDGARNDGKELRLCTKT